MICWTPTFRTPPSLGPEVMTADVRLTVDLNESVSVLPGHNQRVHDSSVIPSVSVILPSKESSCHIPHHSCFYPVKAQHFNL